MIWGIRGLGDSMRSCWQERAKRWAGLGSRQGQGQGTLEGHGVGEDESRGDLGLGRSCRMTLWTEDWVRSAFQPQETGGRQGGATRVTRE